MGLQMFDPEFASPSDWATCYRDLGLQVVPAATPSKAAAQWKRPLVEWVPLQNELAPDFTFLRWYGPSGEHVRRHNMGLITGKCSDRVFVVDLDTQKNVGAQAWWDDVINSAQRAGDLETAEQVTGGGGRQLLFRAPEGWTAPTCKSPIGVDIRGQGGFAVLPPSMHESGRRYEWVKGFAPWETDIADAPTWLCDKIDLLVKEYGSGGSSAPSGIKTDSPGMTHSAFGQIIDGREEYATRFVWGRVVDLWRDSPIPPTGDQMASEMRDAFSMYERAVKSRLVDPGVPNHVLLEREGRGISMFKHKWDHAISQWDGKVSEHGQKEPPRKHEAQNPAPLSQPVEGNIKFNPETGEIFRELPPDGVYEVLNVKEIKTLPDPQMLIEGMIIDRGFGLTFGAPGSTKTFFDLDISLSIAAGLPHFWGRKIHKTGPVIYISSEGVSDMKFRIMAWEQKSGINTDETPFFLIKQTINFMLASDVERLVKTVAHVSVKAGNPVLVVVDTVSRVLPGADENLQKDMTLFIGACDAVRETFDTTVMGVHHTSRGGNLRGSTVFDGAADFLFLIEREEGTMNGSLTAKKIKTAEDGWTQQFDIKKTPVGDIAGHESLTLHPLAMQKEVEKQVNKWPEKDILNKVLNAMRAAWDSGKPWSPHAQSRKQGRYAQLHMYDFGINAKTADSILDKWSMSGVISMEIRDKNTKVQGYKVAGRID